MDGQDFVADYDPSLAEALRQGGDDDEVAVIARLTKPITLPEGVRVISRFGDILTLRVRRSLIPELAAREAVAELELARDLGPAVDIETPSEIDALELSLRDVEGDGDELKTTDSESYTRRPSGIKATGRGVVVGILDWGCDHRIRTPSFPQSRRFDQIVGALGSAEGFPRINS